MTVCPHCGKPLPPSAPTIPLETEALRTLFKSNTNRSRMLTLLLDRFSQWVATAEICETIWADQPLWADTSVSVLAYELRKELKPFGYTVTGRAFRRAYGRGGAYQLNYCDAAAR